MYKLIRFTLFLILIIGTKTGFSQCGSASGAASASGAITSGGAGGEATHVVGATLSGTCATSGCSLIYMIRAEGPTTAYSSQSSNPNQTISLSIDGTYTLKSCVKAAGGSGWCESVIGTVTVDPPCFTPTDISGPTSANLGDTQSFTASNSTGTSMFTWSVTGGTLSSTTGTSVSVTWNTAGNQTLTVTKTDTNCPGSTDTDSHNIDVTDTSCIELVATGAACGTPPANPSFGIQTFNPGASYSWTASGGSPSSGTGTSFSTTYNTSGVYQICVTAMGGNEPWCGPTTDCRNYSVDASCGSGGGGNSATCPIAFGISGPTVLDAGATGTYSPSPDQSGAPQYFTLTWSASGASGSNGSYSWSSPGIYTVCATFSEPGCPDQMACKTVEVVQPCPGFTLSVNGSYTCGAPTGSVSAVPSGQMNPITFLWSNGSTSSAITNVPTGSYSVTVTDATGCAVTGGYNLGGSCMPCGLDVDITGPECVCTDGGEACHIFQITTNFAASSITSYNMFSFGNAGDPVPSSITNNGGGAFEICFDTPGQHSIGGFASGGAGCTDTEFIYVDVKAFSFGLGNYIVCPGETTEVTVFTKQTGTFFYNWSNGQTTKTADLDAGLHCVTVTNYDPNAPGGGGDDGGGPKPNQDCEVELCVEVEEENFEIYCEGLNPHCQMGDGSIAIFIEPIGGDLSNSTFTYLWSTGQTTDNLRGLDAGDYSVTVTTFNGCSKSCSISLVDEPGVEATISATSGCIGEPINLSSTLSDPGATVEYFWSGPNGFMSDLPNPTIPNATLLDEGTYILYIEDMFGCTDVKSIMVELLDNPTLVIDDLQCSADLSSYTVVFTSNATVTASGYTVVGNTVPNIPIGNDVTLVAGTAPCSTTVMVMAPDCSCPMINPPFDPVNEKICLGETIPSISASSDPGTSINWYDAPMGGNLLLAGSNSYTPTFMNPIAAGVYTFYAEAVDDATSCTSSIRLAVSLTIVELPVVTDVQTTDETCDNMNGQIIISFDDNPTMMGLMFSIDGGMTYPFSSADDAGSYTIMNLDAGNYDLFVQWMGMECPVDIPDAFIQNVDGPTVTVSNDGPACEGETTNLSSNVSGGTPNYSYDWEGPNGFSSDEANPAIVLMDAMANGTYSLTVTDDNGCQSIATTEVEFYDLPTLAVNNDGPICHDEDVTVTATVTGGTGPFTYTWTGPNNFTNSNSSFTISNATADDTGDYELTLEDGNGCIIEGVTNVHVTEENTFTYTTECNLGTNTYTVFINAMYGDGITHSTGTLSGTAPDWELEVTAGQDVTITSTNSMTMCDSEPVNVASLDCACEATAPTLVPGERCGSGEITLTGSGDANCSEIRWYADGTSMTPLFVGSSYTESYTSTTTVYAACYYSVQDCESARAMVTVTINPLPNIDSTTPSCAADNMSYTIVVTTSGATSVTTDYAGASITGSGISYTISGIPVGTDVEITAISSGGCEMSLIETSPNCACEATAPMLLAGERCGSGEITLTGSGDANCSEIRWYADGMSTTPLFVGSSYTESYTSTTTVYAACYNSVQDCESARAMVTATINPLPNIDSTTPSCAADNMSYTNVVTTSGATSVTTDYAGASITGSGNSYTISGIPVGTDVEITAISSEGCEMSLVETSPNCACEATAPMLVAGERCGSGEITLTGSGDANCSEIRWYADGTSTTPLFVGSSYTESYTSTTTVYAACYYSVQDCESARAMVTATINPLPSIDSTTPSCAADNMSYTIVVTTSGATSVTTDYAGASITGSGNSYTISGIPVGTDVEITAISSGGCEMSLIETSPNCACEATAPMLVAGERCGSGEITLTGSGDANCSEIRWYADGTSTTPLFVGSSYSESYTSTTTVYASCYYSVQDCESARAMVTATINPIPSIDSTTPSCAADNMSYTIVVTTSGATSVTTDYAGASITGSGNSYTISGIPIGTDVEITAISSEGCEDLVNVSSPNCCPLESIDVPAFCNRGANLTDQSDDFLQFALNLDGPTGGSYTLTGASVTPLVGQYNTTVLFSLPVGSPGAGDVSISITDDNDASCNAVLTIIDPGVCPTDCPSSNCFDIKVTKN